MISGAELILLVLVISEVMKFVLHVYGVFKENTTLRASRLELLKWYACIVGLSLPVFFATREPFPFSDHIVVLVSFTLTGLAYFFGQVLVRRCRDSGWPKSDCILYRSTLYRRHRCFVTAILETGPRTY